MSGVPADAPTGTGFIGRIPVRNLWFLMLYASDLARSGGRFKGMTEDDANGIPDLIGRLLVDQVERRMRRDLTRGYVRRACALTRVRGRIDVLRTETRQLLSRGEVHCRFEELTFDTARNRLVRAALDRMARLVGDVQLGCQCRSLAVEMARAGVGGLCPSRAELTADQIGRNDDADRFMIALAKLAFDLALLTERAGPTSMAYPDREEAWVRRLFEKAVLGFAKLEFEPLNWTVHGGGRLTWPVTEASRGLSNILPQMVTDIIMDAPTARRLVIDTKFAAIVRKGRFDQERLCSAYLYQIYAYLRTQEGKGPPWLNASGLLLHPALDTNVNEHGMVQGHRIQFTTVNLSASTTEIRRQLFSALEWGAGQESEVVLRA